jgi:general secretion pathway protein F
VRFVLNSVDAANRVVALQVDAVDEAAARESAREQGYAVLSVSRGSRVLGALRPAPAFPVTLFSIELLALLDAGMNVIEALQTLNDKQRSAHSRRVIGGILESLRRGQSLSQAIASAPAGFSTLYVATIQSSEKTGNIREALSRYIAYEEELDRVRKKIAAALIYPAILVAVGTLVLAFLMLYVVPRFARVYEDMASDLPFFSSLLLHTGRWIEQHGLAAALGLAVLGGLCTYALSRKEVRQALVDRLWRIPALGERALVYQLARFYRTLGMLLRAGIPVTKALEMVPSLLPSHLQHRVAAALRSITEGHAISAALTSAGLATTVATRLMSVGERSGHMAELMDRTAHFYDDETARFVDAFARIFEPALMALIGLAVGFVVVLMYMPVFELAGSIR